MRLQRTLPRPEDIGSFASDDPADRLTMVTCPLDDLLDRDPVLPQGQDRGVGLFAAQVALVLKAFGRGQQVRVDRRRADHPSDLPHRLAYGVEERLGGVVHEMPTIRDLDGVRQRLGDGLAVAAASIARHDGDAGMAAQPVLRRRLLAISQERDRPSALKVTDDRAVAMVPPPGEVIDADHTERIRQRPCPSPDEAQQRVVAHRGHQPCSKRCGRPSAQGEAKVMDDVIQAVRSPGERRQGAIGKPFGEDPALAEDGVTLKAPNHHHEHDAAAAEWKVRGTTPIAAAHAARSPAAVRAGAIVRLRPYPDDDPVRLDRGALDNEACRNEVCDPLSHRADSPVEISATTPAVCIRNESVPRFKAKGGTDLRAN
jgi:hypothetical protein